MTDTNPSPTAREQALEVAFRNVDDKDWEYLFLHLLNNGSGHGQFWSAVMREARRALAKSSPPTGEWMLPMVRGWMIRFRNSVAGHATFYGVTDDQLLGISDRDHAIILETRDAALKIIEEVGWTEAEAIPVAALMSTPAPQRQRIGSRTWDAYDLKYGTNCRAKMRAAPQRQTVDDAAVERVLREYARLTLSAYRPEYGKQALLAAFTQEN